MTRLRPLTPELLRSYRLTRYRVGPLEARIGRRVTGWPERGPVVLLSACNPGGRLKPAGWNDRMMTHLITHLQGVVWRPGVGQLGRWQERLVAVWMPVARALRLARLFRQNAVVVLRNGRPARLVLLGGKSGRADLSSR